MRFSDHDFLSSKDNAPVFALNSTGKSNASLAASGFDGLVDRLMAKTAERAASNQPQTAAATTVYTLAQCTPDLSAAECTGCLGQLMDILSYRVRGQEGERVAGVRCNLRFEVYPFYIGDAMVRLEGSEASSPAPLPSSPPSPSLPKNTVPAVTPASPSTKEGTKKNLRNKNPQLQEVTTREPEEGTTIWRVEDGSFEFSMFEFCQIADATHNFSDGNKLGEGGFGRVYKGQLPNGLDIAVKRLNPHSGQGLNEFKTEIQLIAKLQHTNLVKLLGCCIEGEEKILIYEYMSNKSLDFFIFDTTRGALLNWNMRRHIIEGIAQGLLYLHKHSRLRVIHRDLKASNILLDENMSPKISDFVIARIFGSNETHATTSRVVGTHGYMAPEYSSEGMFSIKSDVFSFGVLLLEIIGGKRNIGFHQSGNFTNLLGYVWLLWEEEKWFQAVDPCLDINDQNMEVKRFINVGLLCVQDNAMDRPTMTDVISMLMNESASLRGPKQPAYFNIRGDERRGTPD
ncbi:hypothetical protein ACP4OV_031034 [Aristida adscensionis]